MNKLTSLAELEKALFTLNEALQFSKDAQNDPITRDACIQRFKYCIELAWKIPMRKIGSTTKAAKPAIREMARSDLIDSTEIWLDFIEARNDSSHSYDEDIAKKVFLQIQSFAIEAQTLLTRLKK